MNVEEESRNQDSSQKASPSKSVSNQMKNKHKKMTPNQLLFIHCGKAGNAIGEKMWDLLRMEHGINEFGQISGDNNNIFSNSVFDETIKGKFVPRAIFVDYDDSPDILYNNGFQRLCNKDQFISGYEDDNVVFSHHLTKSGKEVVSKTIESIRTQLENTNPSAIILVGSSAGGAGSSLTYSLMKEMKEKSQKAPTVFYDIFQSSHNSNTPISYYNTMFNLHNCISLEDIRIVAQNEAIYPLCQSECPTIDDVNHLCAQTLTSFTVGSRFNDSGEASISTIIANLVPYQRAHFVSCSLAPLFSIKSAVSATVNPPEIFIKQEEGLNHFSSFHDKNNIFSSFGLTRGSDTLEKIANNTKICARKSLQKPASIPEFNIGIPNTLNLYLSTTAGFSNGVSQVREHAHNMYEKKLYVEKFISDGFEESAFKEAFDGLSSICSDYNTFKHTLSDFPFMEKEEEDIDEEFMRDA